jgi:hypothetical protein
MEDAFHQSVNPVASTLCSIVPTENRRNRQKSFSLNLDSQNGKKVPRPRETRHQTPEFANTKSCA